MSNPAKDTLETLDTLAGAIHRHGAARPCLVDFMTAGRWLRKAAAALLSDAESQCNGVMRWDATAGRMVAGWDDSDQEKSDRLRDRERARALDALRMVFGSDLAGLEVEFQADPRGAMVKLWPTGRRDAGSPIASF